MPKVAGLFLAVDINTDTTVNKVFCVGYRNDVSKIYELPEIKQAVSQGANSILMYQPIGDGELIMLEILGEIAAYFREATVLY